MRKEKSPGENRRTGAPTAPMVGFVREPQSVRSLKNLLVLSGGVERGSVGASMSADGGT